MKKQSNQSWIERDLQKVWHPCTQMKDHENQLPLIPIQKGEGIWLYDFDGNRYLDAISSWWVNLFGHNHPHIKNKIKAQLDQLDHVLLAGFTHQPVIELSEKLIEITPPGLNKCFYADNGSSAVEVALKMSFHYWKNKGKNKKNQFVCLANSYHGETLGALAVGDVGLYRETYKPLLMKVITAPSPDAFLREPEMSKKEWAEIQFLQIKKILEMNHAEISAVIIEPLVQCAGGMRMYDASYLSLLRTLCTQLNIHLIADEIAVGFGRTGSLFACEQASVTPDFLCLSKGLTGGFLPLSVVMTHDEIYNAFYDDYAKQCAFLHSHSYTGNPLACSAAIATLELFEKEQTIQKNEITIEKMKHLSQPWKNYPHVADVRQQGMILAIELMQDPKNKIAFPWQDRTGLKVYKYALQQGVLLRPLGDVIYLMPPYVINDNELVHLFKVVDQCLQNLPALK